MSDVIDPRVLVLGLKAREIARLEKAGRDAEFGKIIAIGKSHNALWLLLLFVPMAVLALTFFVVLTASGKHVRNPSMEVTIAVSGAVISLASGILTWWLSSNRGAKYRFFEQGATLHRGDKDLIRWSYLDIAAMTYALVRQSYNGMYVGTSGTFRLDGDKGSKVKPLKCSFRHQEKAKGLLRRRFEGGDPMDVVRDTVADVVAERLALEIAEKGEAAWTGPATFTKDGLRIKKLLGAPAVVAYDKIDRLGFGDGTLVLFEEGSEKAFVSMAVNGKNFWPGFVLFQKLMKPRGGAEEVDATEFEEDGD
jgi:hypothetical protein